MKRRLTDIPEGYRPEFINGKYDEWSDKCLKCDLKNHCYKRQTSKIVDHDFTVKCMKIGVYFKKNLPDSTERHIYETIYQYKKACHYLPLYRDFMDTIEFDIIANAVSYLMIDNSIKDSKRELKEYKKTNLYKKLRLILI